MSLGFTWMHGYIAGKITTIFPGLNAKVGKFGLSRSNMMFVLRIGLYALLGILLADSGVTLTSSFVNYVSIILVVIIIDIMASRNHDR